MLEIDDIISFHGESASDFERVLREPIDRYFEACDQLSQDPNKPASGKLMLRIPPEVRGAALAAAKRSGQSLNKRAARVPKEAAHRPA